jgi:hypothetical protein
MTIVATKEESPTRTVLEIEVPAERVEEAITETVRTYTRRAAIPGFRKGKAPESVVRQRFGDQIRADALEALLPDAVADAIKEKQLSILGRPRVEDLKWEPPGPIRFFARLDLKPAIDAGDWRGVPVQDEPVEPAEEEVTKVIDRIREAHAEFHPVEGAPRRPGTSRSPTSPARSSRSSRRARRRARSRTRRSPSRSATPTRCRRSTTPSAARSRGKPGASARPSPMTSPTTSSAARRWTTRSRSPR